MSFHLNVRPLLIFRSIWRCMTMTLSQKFKFLDQFEEQIKTLKTVLSHVGLYVGLIAYTALGAWVSKQITIKRNVMCTL